MQGAERIYANFGIMRYRIMSDFFISSVSKRVLSATFCSKLPLYFSIIFRIWSIRFVELKTTNSKKCGTVNPAIPSTSHLLHDGLDLLEAWPHVWVFLPAVVHQLQDGRLGVRVTTQVDCRTKRRTFAFGHAWNDVLNKYCLFYSIVCVFTLRAPSGFIVSLQNGLSRNKTS